MPFGSPRLYLAATLYSRVNILLVAIDSTVWTPVYSDQGLSRDGDLRSSGSLIQILSICACFARCTGAAPTFFYFCAVPLVHVFLICRHLLLTINLFAAYMTLYAAFSLESSSSSPPLSWLLGYDGRPPPPKWTAALSSWFVFTRSWTSWPGACPNQGASCILHLTTTASLCKLICTMTALGQDIFEKSLILFRIEVPHLSPLPLSQCRVSYLPILSPWCVSGVN